MKRGSFHRLRARLAALAILFLAGGAHSSAQETISPLPEAQIREVTSRILQSAERANCKPQDCKIVVANFTLPSGLTSQLGIRLADAFSKELASQQNGIQVIDRSILMAYLEKERIPPDLLASEKALRWLGKQLAGTTVLMGTTQPKASLVQVQVSLLPCNKEKGGPTELFNFPLPESKNVLSGFDPITKLVSEDKLASRSAPYKAGVNGVTQPVCVYCPAPALTKAGRDAKFNGAVLLDIEVSAEGHATEVRIVRGVPYDLNEEAIHAVQNWKFKPSTLNGAPVTTKATVEIGFRLN